MKTKILVAITSVLIFVAVFNTGCFEDDGGSQKSSKEVKIINITQDPISPKAGEVITFTAIVENCSECMYGLVRYFAMEGSGGGFRNRINVGKYEKEIGPFPNGTEVWFKICAIGIDGPLNVSKDYIIQIGKIERSNITTLSIMDVHQFPQNPTSKDSWVTIRANVTSNVTLTSVEGGYMKWSRSLSSHGTFSMNPSSGSTFETQFGFILKSGTNVYYKIDARDESGNTALSQTFSFVIS